MERKERFRLVTEWFRTNMPEPRPELHFDSPFHLLIAVMLSAQCTDKRVNMHTPEIFRRYPTPSMLAAASFDEVFPLVKSISYPNSKAEHLIEMAKMLCEEFGGQVPSDIDSLQKLPGVGRKTANVVASIVYDKPVIAVDTHVFRLSRRLGLSDGKTVETVERDLTAGIAEKERATAHHWLILHGRYVCTARNPHCSECGLSPFCREFTGD